MPLKSRYEENVPSENCVQLLTGLEQCLKTSDSCPRELLHDLWLTLARWFSRLDGQNKQSEACLSQAMAAHYSHETLLLLIEVQRKSPSLSLVDNLLTLAEVEQQSLKLLNEAASIALALEENESAVLALEKLFTQSVIRLQQQAEDGVASEAAIWATQKLVHLCKSKGELSRAMQQLEATAVLPLNARSRLQSLYDASLIAQELSDETKAIAFCEQALAVERSVDTESLMRSVMSKLGELLESKGQWEKLLQLRRDELSGSETSKQRSKIRLDIARVMGLLDAPAAEREELLTQNLIEVPGDSGRHSLYQGGSMGRELSSGYQEASAQLRGSGTIRTTP